VTGSSNDSVFEAVADVLVELIRQRGDAHLKVEASSSIVEDLGLDSLAMVDLTILLEEKLSIVGFSIQAWLDAEAMKDVSRYTVASLVQECRAVLAS
jgi:acyl carrier protein